MDHINSKWVEQKLRNVLYSLQFCGLCMESEEDMLAVVTQFNIYLNGEEQSKPLIDIINYVFQDVNIIPTSSYVCSNCADKTIESYIFINKVKKASEVVNIYIKDFNSKALHLQSRLDPSYTYANSNILIILENNTKPVIISNKTLHKKVNLQQDSNKVPSKEVEILTSKQPLKRKNVYTIVTNSASLNKPHKSIINDQLLLQDKFLIREIRMIEVENSLNSQKRKITKKTEVQKKLLKRKNEITIMRKDGYECVQCETVLPTFKQWKEHENTYHKTRLECKVCSKTFNNETILTAHYVTHSKVKCRICYIYLQDTELTEHLKLNHRQETHPCQHCGLSFYTAPALIAHLKISHITGDYTNDIDENIQCLMCLKYFKKDQTHSCRDKCPECSEIPCLHHKYLIDIKKQMLNHWSKLKCLDCNFMCRRKEVLITHTNRLHLNYHPYCCDDCGTQFYSKSLMKRHIMNLHRVKLCCEYCDRQYTSNSRYENHIQACKLITRPFRCEECPASFDTPVELSNHERIKHSTENFPCSMCRKIFLTQEALKDHQTRSHRKLQLTKPHSRWMCVVCEQEFDLKGDYNRHMREHGPDVKFPCRICNIKFDNVQKFHWHNRMHKRKVKKKDEGVCTLCHKEVSSLRSHMYTHALKNKDPIHICELCGKSFPLNSLLKLHRLVHMDKVECEVCKKMVKPASMSSHRRVHQPKPKVKKQKRNYPKCDYCDFRASPIRLVCHINRCHLQIKPYVCEICNEAFCGQFLLDSHMRVHSNEKKYTCEICCNKFRFKLSLKKHMMLHTGEKPNVCDVCGEGFTCTSHLKEHKLKHFDKSVRCPMCGMLFHAIKNMRQHIKKKHWRDKDRKFDPKEILDKQFHCLFEDRRRERVKCISD